MLVGWISVSVDMTELGSPGMRLIEKTAALRGL